MNELMRQSVSHLCLRVCTHCPAGRCQVEENDVKKCLQHLLYYGLIKMIDTFAVSGPTKPLTHPTAVMCFMLAGYR